jgi:outer membrane usher protein FimD/PapC
MTMCLRQSGLDSPGASRLRCACSVALRAFCLSLWFGGMAFAVEGEVALPTPTAAPAPVELPVGVLGVSDAPTERTLFDLYLADKFVGGILIDYTDTWCEVDDPLGALEQVPDFQKDRAEEVVPLLAGRFERTRVVGGIGKVTCDIFTFRLVLELERDFLKAQAKTLSNRVADPEGGVSLQQNLGVAASGEFSGESNSAFSHRSVIGLGRFFGRFSGAAIQGEQYELTEASSFGYLGDFEIGGGFLETRGQTFANSLQFTGLQARTSDKLLLDPELGRGSLFEIFVPSRARVEFYRSGRLISVQSLDFGLQEVDTRNFPQGSYDVDVVITESNGRVTQDRKFFTKSGFLSVRGRPTYDLQGGVIREEFSTQDTPVYFAALQWRVTDILDVGASVYGADDLSIGQATLSGLYRESYFLGGTSYSTEGDFGLNGSFSTRILDTSVNLSGAKAVEVSSSSRQLSFVPTPGPNDPPDFIPKRDRSTELYFNDRESYSINVRRYFGKVELGYLYLSEIYSGGDLRRTQGPTLQWSIWDGANDGLRYLSTYYDTDVDTVWSNSLAYRYRFSPEWNLGAQAGYFDRSDYDEVVGFLTVTYQDRRRSVYASRFSLTSEARSQKGPGNKNDGDLYSTQLNGEYGGDYLYGRGFVREQAGSRSGDSSYGVTAESAVLVGSDGTAALSYPMAQDSVFIANIRGASPGTRFHILLNDQIFDTVEAGKRSAVSVSPFKTYKVAIRPEDPNQLVDYSTTVYTVTFFPGNVVERAWDVSQVMIVLGRLVDAAGTPLPVVRIKGTNEYVATDDLGFFQAELEGDEVLTVDSPAGSCRVELGRFERPEYFVDLGDVICRPEKKD